MTQLYKKNGAVFIPIEIKLEEVEKMKCCDNCKNYKFEIEQKYCFSNKPCKNKSEWELAE